MCTDEHNSCWFRNQKQSINNAKYTFKTEPPTYKTPIIWSFSYVIRNHCMKDEKKNKTKQNVRMKRMTWIIQRLVSIIKQNKKKIYDQNLVCTICVVLLFSLDSHIHTWQMLFYYIRLYEIFKLILCYSRWKKSKEFKKVNELCLERGNLTSRTTITTAR